MAETIHKGWLKTREDEKFAPKTFIDNVFDSTGKQYDAVIKDHINSVAQTIKIDGIDTSVEDTFYVCDNSGNVIARIDKDGVHSIDFTISNNSVKEALADLTRSYELVSKDVEDIQESLQNLDTSDSNTFYICDGSGNVIFRVDAEGAFSTNFSTKSGDVNDALSRLSILEQRLSWMDETDDTVFMIVDNKGNKAFEISSATNGAMAYDFVLPEAVSIGNVEVNTLREAIAVLDNVEADLTVLEGTAAKDSDLQALEGRVDSLTQTITALDEALDWEDDSNFTIVDSNGNKIATFDTSGSTSINFVIGTTGWDKKYDNLVEVIDALISLENKYASTIGDPFNPVDGTVLYRLAQLDSWKSIASSQIAQLQEADIALSGRIDVLEDFKDNIDNTYATDEDVKVLAGRISDLEAADILINADIDALEVKDSSLQSQITTLSGEVDKIQEVIDVEEDTTVIITDASNNKIVEVNQSGITSVDFVVSQYYTNENGESVILNEKSPNSLIGVIDAINNLDSKYATDTQLSDAIATEKSRAMDAESSLRQDVNKANNAIGEWPAGEYPTDKTKATLREELAKLDTRIDELENFKNSDALTEAEAEAKYLTIENAEITYYTKKLGEETRNIANQNAASIGAITDTTNTTLWGAINAEIARATEAEKGLSDRIDVIINNPETADTIDSIVEFTKYIEDHGDIAQGFSDDISDLKSADTILNGRIDNTNNRIDGIQEVIDVEEDTTVIITDASNNKIVEVNQSGITSVDFVVSQYYTNENGESVILNEKSPNSLIGVIDAINNLDSKYATDTQLSDAIATEKSRAMDAESSLRQDVNKANNAIGEWPAGEYPTDKTKATLREELAKLDTRIDELENFKNSDALTEAEAEAKYLTIENAEITYYTKKLGEETRNIANQNAASIGAITDTTNTTLWGAINAEIARATEAEKGLSDRIDVIINNPETADTIDSIVEFTKYIEDHGDIAQGFSDDISDLKSADTILNGRIDNTNNRIDGIEEVIDITVGDTALTVVDNNGYKIMEVNNAGAASVDFIVSPVYDASGTATERTPNSLIGTIDKLNSLDVEIGDKPSDSGITATKVWPAIAQEKARAMGVESELRTDVNSKVPETRKVNGLELKNDITITTVENATNAANAEKATADANGNEITSTYLTKSSASEIYLTQSDAAEDYANKELESTVTTLSSDFKTFKETTVPATYATKEAVDTFINATAPATYLKKTEAFTQNEADGLYYPLEDGRELEGIVSGHVTSIGALNIFKDTVPDTYVTQTAYNEYVGTTAPATYVSKDEAFTQTTADELYAAKTIESTVSGHTQSIDALRIFKNVKVGDTTISADTGVDDTLTLIAGDGITLTPDAVNDAITITGTAEYTLPVATTSTLGGIKPVTTTANSAYKYLNSYVDTDGTLYTIFPAIVNNSKIETDGTTIAFSISGQEFSQKIAIDGGSLSVSSAEWADKARIIAPGPESNGYSIGNTNKPIYFNEGIPVEISYEINKSVPADAVFTDTHLKSENVVGASATAILNGEATNGNVYLNHIEDDDEVISSHKIIGTGGTTVTSDANGNITIHSESTSEHYEGKNVIGKTSTSTTDELTTQGTIYLNHVENDVVTSSHRIEAGQGINILSTPNGIVTIGANIETVDYATKAGQLDDSVSEGAANEPVYFNNGVPTKIDYQINKTVPANAVFTDTKVTSVDNHYAPEADSASTLSKDASGSSAAAWGNTSLVTGVNIQRDAKGHVTDITLDAVKMPANPTSDFTIDYVDTTDQFEGIVKPGQGDESDIYWYEGVATVKDNSHNHTIANITGLSDKIDPISMDDTSTFKIVDNSGNILAEFNAAEGLVVPKIKVQNVAGNAEWVPAYLAADTSIELQIN